MRLLITAEVDLDAYADYVQAPNIASTDVADAVRATLFEVFPHDSLPLAVDVQTVACLSDDAYRVLAEGAQVGIDGLDDEAVEMLGFDDADAVEQAWQAAVGMSARDSLIALARRIGAGFHPDTRGADYTSLPDGLSAEQVDGVVERAFAAGVDVYGVALDAVQTDA